MGTTVARGRKPTGEVGAEDWLGFALGEGAADAAALVDGLSEVEAPGEELPEGPDPTAMTLLAPEARGCPANPPRLGRHPAASPAAPTAETAPTSRAIPRTERRERRCITSIASTRPRAPVGQAHVGEGQ